MNIRFEVDKENLRLFLEDVPSKVRRNTLEMISMSPSLDWLMLMSHLPLIQGHCEITWDMT